MGLISFRQPAKRESKRGDSTKSRDQAKQTLSRRTTEATPPQNSQNLPSGEAGGVRHILGDQTFGFDGFPQIDLSGANVWDAEFLSYNEDWVLAASTPSTMAEVAWRDEVLDPAPIGFHTEQGHPASSRGGALTADSAADVAALCLTAQSLSDPPQQLEPRITVPRKAPSVSCTSIPSLSPPSLESANPWLPISGTVLLPPQSLYQVSPEAATEAPNPASFNRHEEGKTRADDRSVKVEQCHTDALRSADPSEMLRQQGSMNGRDNIANTLETQASASDIASAATLFEHDSLSPDVIRRHSTPALSCVQSPLQTVGQASQRETIPIEALPPATTTLNPRPNGLRKSARIDTVASQSTHRQLGAKRSNNPKKRLYVEIYAGGDSVKDSEDAGATKPPRLRTVRKSTPGRAAAAHSLGKRRLERPSSSQTSEDEPGNMSPAEPFRQPLARTLARSSGANEQELMHLRSRHDYAPHGGIRDVRGHGRLENPEAKSRQPIHQQTSREIRMDGCSSCCFHAEHLFQLTERAWRCLPKEDALLEALFESDTGFSDANKKAIMLRLCLGSICKYAKEMVTGRQPGHLTQPTMALPEYTETEKTTADTSAGTDSSSDADSDDDHDNRSEGAVSDGDSDINDRGGSNQCNRVSSRGARWSRLEEQRLRSYVKENKDWSWIAAQLGRTESAVAQHWRMMG